MGSCQTLQRHCCANLLVTRWLTRPIQHHASSVPRQCRHFAHHPSQLQIQHRQCHGNGGRSHLRWRLSSFAGATVMSQHAHQDHNHHHPIATATAQIATAYLRPRSMIHMLAAADCQNLRADRHPTPICMKRQGIRPTKPHTRDAISSQSSHICCQ